jgi:hypothetical protein
MNVNLLWRSWPFALALAVPAALAVACSGSHSTGFTSPDGSSTSTTSADGAVSPSGGGDGATVSLTGNVDANVGDNSTVCPESATLVYVTGSDNVLWSFYPPTLPSASAFTKIGKLTCLDSPTHMTVDRQGTAWIVANSKLYNASTADASCSAVKTWTPHLGNFSDFALTFIGTSTTSVDTTLYMLGPSDLGTFDTSTGTVAVIGAPKVPSTQGDMTSNGDGTLYFLMDDKTLALYELNPSTDAVMQTLKPSAAGGGDQALAFWGGYFYAFENDVVYQFDPKAQTTTKVGTAPLQVTGAGQSTCVPKTFPTTK